MTEKTEKTITSIEYYMIYGLLSQCRALSVEIEKRRDIIASVICPEDKDDFYMTCTSDLIYEDNITQKRFDDILERDKIKIVD